MELARGARALGAAVLWVESYARSLSEPEGPWAGFAAQSVADWLAVLASTQPPRARRTKSGTAERTLALAVVRGALLDLLATGDTVRSGATLRAFGDSMRRP